MKKQDNLKKAALRLIGIAAAAAVTIASISFSNVSAENTAKDDFELSILETSTKSDVYTVSSQNTAEGNVTVHVGVYIESEDWPSDDYIEMACARWAASDSSWMHFTNISDLTEKSST
ncbi:MAG: hypothetical protein LUC50_09690 [Ruminococcus sp.]|nr:hypothetical protein [Ruminococcus sp.]